MKKERIFIMFDRMQCLNCGEVQYTLDPLAEKLPESNDFTAFVLDAVVPDGVDYTSCPKPDCQGKCVPVTENMNEIAIAFYDTGYSVAHATDLLSTDDCFQISVHITNMLPKTVLPDLPKGFIYLVHHTTEKEETHTHGILFHVTKYSDYPKYERELLREDALAALYTWITDLSKTGNPEIWSLAGLL